MSLAELYVVKKTAQCIPFMKDNNMQTVFRLHGPTKIGSYCQGTRWIPSSTHLHNLIPLLMHFSPHTCLC